MWPHLQVWGFLAGSLHLLCLRCSCGFISATVTWGTRRFSLDERLTQNLPLHGSHTHRAICQLGIGLLLMLPKLLGPFLINPLWMTKGKCFQSISDSHFCNTVTLSEVEINNKNASRRPTDRQQKESYTLRWLQHSHIFDDLFFFTALFKDQHPKQATFGMLNT